MSVNFPSSSWSSLAFPSVRVGSQDIPGGIRIDRPSVPLPPPLQPSYVNPLSNRQLSVNAFPGMGDSVSGRMAHVLRGFAVSPVNLGFNNRKFLPSQRQNNHRRQNNVQDFVVGSRETGETKVATLLDQGLRFSDQGTEVRRALEDLTLHRIDQRKKQVICGKMTEGWLRWELIALAKNRGGTGIEKIDLLDIPLTPTPQDEISKRNWDYQIKEWRISLHSMDENVLDPEIKQFLDDFKNTPEGSRLVKSWMDTRQERFDRAARNRQNVVDPDISDELSDQFDQNVVDSDISEELFGRVDQNVVDSGISEELFGRVDQNVVDSGISEELSRRIDQRNQQVMSEKAMEGWLNWKLIALAESRLADHRRSVGSVSAVEGVRIPVTPNTSLSDQDWDLALNEWKRGLQRRNRNESRPEIEALIKTIKNTPEGARLVESWMDIQNEYINRAVVKNQNAVDQNVSVDFFSRMDQRNNQVLSGKSTEGWLNWQLLNLAHKQVVLYTGSSSPFKMPVQPIPLDVASTNEGWDQDLQEWRSHLDKMAGKSARPELKILIEFAKKTAEGVRIVEEWMNIRKECVDRLAKIDQKKAD